MKRQSLALAFILAVTIIFGNITASAAEADDGILTLEEAKALALKNDIQFNQQQSYIQQASESYEDIYEKNTKSDNTNYKSLADRASASISRKVSIENAASNIRKEIFKRNDLKRASDYSVTSSYYNVLNAVYALENAEAEIGLKQKELELVRIKHGLSLVTKKELTLADSEFASAQNAYKKAFSDLQNKMAELSRNIGKNLDVFNDKLDMTLMVPDIKLLDLNKIKEDYMKNNQSFYNAKEAYDLAEYKLQLTEEQYDYYYKRLPNRTSSIVEQFDDMLEKARRDFEDAKYTYNEKEKELDLTLLNQYTTINDLYETYEKQKKDLEDAKLEIENSKLKYQMGIIKKSDLESSIAELGKKENQLNSTIINLNLQYLNLTQYSIYE